MHATQFWQTKHAFSPSLLPLYSPYLPSSCHIHILARKIPSSWVGMVMMEDSLVCVQKTYTYMFYYLILYVHYKACFLYGQTGQ